MSRASCATVRRCRVQSQDRDAEGVHQAAESEISKLKLEISDFEPKSKFQGFYWRFRTKETKSNKLKKKSDPRKCDD